MERTQLFDLMGELKLYGMKAAYDEIMASHRPIVLPNENVYQCRDTEVVKYDFSN